MCITFSSILNQKRWVLKLFKLRKNNISNYIFLKNINYISNDRYYIDLVDTRAVVDTYLIPSTWHTWYLRRQTKIFTGARLIN